MLPYQMIAGGRFTLTTALIASGVSVQCNSQNPPDFIVARAITGWGEASDAQAIEWFWERSMSQGAAKGILQASEGSTPQLPAMSAYSISSNGIYTYDTANPPTSTPLVAATAVTKGGAGGVTVVTVTNDGVVGPIIVPGDYVLLTGVTGMQQISGMTFLVVDTTSTTSITLDLDSSGFAASGTAATVRKVIPNKDYPRWAYITDITQATSCIVDVITNTDFTVGEEVSFRVPANASGFTTMSEIANKKGVVTAVTAATTTTCSKITVDIDSSGFTAFALPTSAQAAAGTGQQPISLLVPAGSGVVPGQNPPGTNLLDAFDNRNIRIIKFNRGLWNVSSHGSDNGDVWMWQAFKYDDYSTSTVTA